VSRNLEYILHRHALATACGSIFDARIDVILSPTTIVQPDLVFIAAARAALISSRGIEGPPDLVVEIVSPSTARQDRVTKPALYPRSGVRFFWVLDPGAQSFEEYELAAGGYQQVQVARGKTPVTTAMFPRLVIELAAVWV
jgi:Uma2 family endonuclease